MVIEVDLMVMIDLMVIEVHFFKKKKKKKNMDKMWKALFEILHILHHRSTNFFILVIFHTFFTLISLKVN